MQREYPGYWRYVWMYSMQELLLQQINNELHIDPNVSIFHLSRSGEIKNIWIQTWLKRSGFLILVQVPFLFIIQLILFRWCDLPVALFYDTVAVAISVSMGVILGITVSLHAGITVIPRVMMLIFGIACITSNIIVGIVAGVVLCVGIGVKSNATLDTNFTTYTWSHFPTVALRQLISNLNPYWMKPPILDYDLLCFSIPFFKTGTLRLAEKDPHLAQEVLKACSRSSGCEESGRHILEQLQAKELVSLAERGDWTLAAELKGTWLAGRENASPSLLGFADTARFILEASHTDDADQQVKILSQARAHLAEHQLYLKFNPTRQNQLLLNTTLPNWETAMNLSFENSESVYLGW